MDIAQARLRAADLAPGSAQGCAVGRPFAGGGHCALDVRRLAERATVSKAYAVSRMVDSSGRTVLLNQWGERLALDVEDLNVLFRVYREILPL